MTNRKPLSGIKVFDATQGVAGPHATMLLAQHGADVIKVEPLDGDWGRSLGKMYGDLCAHAVTFNRGKRSIALDLKSEDGRAVAQKLAAEADIVVESFRPGVMARFGLGYEDIKAKRDDVIYLSVTGFGQEGPYSDQPVTDSVIQAFSGWMSINRDAEGTPQRIGMIAVDVMTGLYAYQAISSALIGRMRFGEGAYIDCSLMQSAAAFQSAKVLEYFIEDGAPQVLYVPVGTMKTADSHINITAMRDRHYVSLCEVLGLEELIDDPRFNTRDKRVAREAELMPMIRAEFLKKTTAEWGELLTEAEVMNSAISDYGDYLKDEHVAAVDGVAWVEHQDMGRIPIVNIPGMPKIDGADALTECAHVGQHTSAILADAGYGADEIAALLASDAVGESNA
ncbi:MAG: CoA transferase [Rhodospirillaceae bacterium]|jgi:crotonobetainyl-CoA:carnitine CoA-transferase CaiB-like acyl-CoA transferase|nr:CoA transferase [Rhodospirillaceae bacterium]MBT3493851.1 CoA transferase [Rhodospirillaceae bacterium]MBT3779841.1 CoA transferase [Rhodospirillaceae bacterium]MBT3977115.1 CoA transferase [Rhodospirillaceae bacterium]MBT4563744.1 CoA transferase [Rhodospirillaceae bacterium]